jgi:single-strand DNA-binding protein
MAFSVNQVTLVGNIANEPELTYTSKGNPMLKFTLATNYSVRTDAGDWEDKPSFHRIVLWGKIAEYLGNNLSKGEKVYLDGRIEYGSYEGNDGVKRYTTDIIAKNVIPMSGGGLAASTSPKTTASDDSSKPAKTSKPKSDKQSKSKPSKEKVEVDDIPF